MKTTAHLDLRRAVLIHWYILRIQKMFVSQLPPLMLNSLTTTDAVSTVQTKLKKYADQLFKNK